MSELALTTALPRTAASVPSTQVDKPKRLRVGKKLQIAIDAIVFEGADLQEAARTANSSTRAIRRALERSHVVAHLRKRREVLRTSAAGQNIRRLVAIRDAAENMPALQAIRELERLGDEQHSAGRISTPFAGVTVNIVHVANEPLARNQPQVIENKEDDQ